jgi:peptidyl-tRNA hydrolase, PTH1 family
VVSFAVFGAVSRQGSFAEVGSVNRDLAAESYSGLDDKSKFMVIGLGNPGRKHRHNRHNLGFMVLDKLAACHEIKLSRVQSQSLIGSGVIESRSVILVKPMTYMNLSGRSVGTLSRYYRIPLNKLVVTYDEIDLPFGIVRIRGSGGSGGHNGMKSIIEHLGSDFPRIRIGVGRPSGRMDPAAYVLQNFSKEEREVVGGIVDRTVDAIELFLREGINSAMNMYNQISEEE